MVGDAVEERAGEAFAGEHRGPFLEGQVGGYDGGAVLVAPAEDIEQEFAAGLREGHVATCLLRCFSSFEIILTLGFAETNVAEEFERSFQERRPAVTTAK